MSAFDYAEHVFLKTLDQDIPAHERQRGILLGLSGGADSMLLLHLLHRLAEKERFPFFALHVNHGIRGTEAERDEAFSREQAQKRMVPFEALRVNVPSVAENEDMGLEETARRLRYELFEKYAQEHALAYVFTAHHASDNAETVLFRLARGAGVRGLCGIPRMRKANGYTIYRPLLSLTGAEIRNAVTAAGISFVTDSTNADHAYKRNFIRHEILPRMHALNPSFESVVARMGVNLSEDMDCLETLAEESLPQVKAEDALVKTALLRLPAAIRYRVFCLFYKEKCPNAPLPERIHTDALFERLVRDGDFSLSFPADIRVCARGEYITLSSALPESYTITSFPIRMGENVLPDGGRLFLLSKNSPDFQTNIYKTSIHRDLSSATIDGRLYVRSKADGDSYRYGGVTHKLKKLFSDAKIPQEERAHIPVVCDDGGILWVPHFGVRNDGGQKEERDMALCYLPPH